MEPIRIAWDWHMPRSTPQERRELVRFVTELGFDVLVVSRPEVDMVETAHEAGIRVVAVLSPGLDAARTKADPEIVQRMLPSEEAMLEAGRVDGDEQRQRLSHRWFPLFQSGDLLCYEHPRARRIIDERVDESLAVADGVALDGFGFRNHYACFCSRCSTAHGSDAERLARFSEESLIGVSKRIYERAKSRRQDAIVLNHVWPPFNPNPYYGARLYLDYCTQTISWFYRPVWPIERVRLEARLHKSLEDKSRNTFVPFIGLYDDPYQRRSADRIRAELDIALEYGEGSVVLCTLEGPAHDATIRAVVKDALLR